MIIYGAHPVLSFLNHKLKIINKVFVTTEQKNKNRNLLDNLKINIITNTSEELDKVTKVKEHQGFAAEITHFPYADINNSIGIVNRICILDHIEDPRNFGAIIRNALAFGIELIIIPKDRACEVTPAVVKASAGAAAVVPIANVTNINQVIRDLKDKNYWIYGFEVSGNNKLSKIDFDKKTVIVLGSEGKGLSSLTKKLCDFLVEIEYNAGAASLNVSSASAIAFYGLFLKLEVA